MSQDISRRSLAVGAGLLAGGLAASAIAQQTATAPAGAKLAVKPLPFDAQAIKGMSAKLLTSHHDINYAGAVARLNAIREQLAALDFDKAPGFVVNGLKREELIAHNSMVLHEIYFDGLGGDGGPPAGALGPALARDFGSVERWRAEFAGTCKALGGGSGWVILAYAPRDKRLFNYWSSDHTATPAAGRPVLVMDMYEHAYQIDYGAAAADYVNAFLQAIKWNSAKRLYGEATRPG